MAKLFALVQRAVSATYRCCNILSIILDWSRLSPRYQGGVEKPIATRSEYEPGYGAFGFIGQDPFHHST
jgi:hypothetical protein